MKTKTREHSQWGGGGAIAAETATAFLVVILNKVFLRDVIGRIKHRVEESWSMTSSVK